MSVFHFALRTSHTVGLVVLIETLDCTVTTFNCQNCIHNEYFVSSKMGVTRWVILAVAGAALFFGLGFSAGTMEKFSFALVTSASVARDTAVTAIQQFQPGSSALDTGAAGMGREVAAVGAVSYERAFRESQQFFDDVSDQDWELLKQRVQEIQPNTNGNPGKGRAGTPFWFQNHYEPDFACRHERRIGRLGDGGKWVCDPHRLKNPAKPCLVYSVGSNGDSSFESYIKKDIGDHCEIHTFDMANYTEKVEVTGAKFHQWGLSDTTGPARKGEFKTLKDTVKLLGHEGRVIDIFKIDCEGCEWSTGKSWFDADVVIRQVLVELHEVKSGIPQPGGLDFFNTMYQQGYVIFHKEPNIQYWQYGRCVEYAFLRLNQTFFQDDNGNSWLKLQS